MIKVLYVEDEPFLAKIVKETLEGQDYKVDLVTDGQDAIEVYKNGNFDVCILDIMLPNVNGFDIAKGIRKYSSKIPILFLTAKDQTEDVVKGFKVGGNDYLRKPFSIEELMARVQNLISLSNNSTDKLRADGIRITSECIFYPHKLELNTSGEIKKLSHKESLILEQLCDHRNDILDRQSLLLKGWGDDSFFNSRTLDVYISKLRSYLSAEDRVKIVTLKGVGYRFVVEE